MRILSRPALVGILGLALLLPSIPTKAAPSSFITISGNQFALEGQAAKVKLVSYYPQLSPWRRMWSRWNATAAGADLDRLKSWGVNVVRVLIPFGQDTDWTDNSGAIQEYYLTYLREFVQMAGERDLKVELTIFDSFNGGNGDPVDLARNRTYINNLTTIFANDDRIFAWNVDNEPDNRGLWRNGQQAMVIDWLTEMVNILHSRDPNHPITIGMGDYHNLWEEGTRKQNIASLVDFLSFHDYNAGDFTSAINAIKQRSQLPILLEEIGWPTGPVCTANYDEQTQAYLYQTAVTAVRSSDIAGIGAWTMWDYIPGASQGGGVETREDHFGLLRRDGSTKPALNYFISYLTSALPSQTHTNFAYDDIPPELPAPNSSNRNLPLYFPETDQSVWNYFEMYWLDNGGLPTFGYPLTPARYEQASDGKTYLVQYFERARMELHPEAVLRPGKPLLIEPFNLLLLVKLSPLGAMGTSGRNFAPGAASTAPGYFAATGHTALPIFFSYWQQHGGLNIYGYPISESLQEVSPTDGQIYTVQYFERQRFEYHPSNPNPYKVELGLLGKQYMDKTGCVN